MTPHQDAAAQWIDRLLSPDGAGAQQWHPDLGARRHLEAPPWLDACAGAKSHLPDASRQQALLNCATQASPLYHRDPADERADPWAEPPAAQLARAGAVVMLALDGAINLPEPSPGLDLTTLGLRDAWLWAAAQALKDEPNPSLHWQPPQAAPHTADVQCPALLVTVARGALGHWQPHGVHAIITMRAVHAPGACLRLVPAPRSACTAITRSFAVALADVRTWLWATLRHDVPALPLADLALAWDLHFARPHGADEAGVSNLSGPSAGVAFGLAGLWLLRAAAPQQFAAALDRLPLDAPARTWATAALQPDGMLATVGHASAKRGMLAPLLNALAHGPAATGAGVACVHVATGQSRVFDDPAPPGAPPMVEHANMLALVTRLHAAMQPPDPAADRLLQQLLTNDDRPQPQEADLAHVAHAMPTPTLERWLLKCWAQWARREGGAVHAHYVPLAVLPDARGPGRAPVQPATPRDMQQLLHDYDATGHHAYVLRGRPGAGKSTLLRHHLMALCRTALRQLAGAPANSGPGTAPAAGSSQAAAPAAGSTASAAPAASGNLLELPLYLPLAALDVDADPLAWVRQRLAQTGAPAQVRHWFSPSAAVPPGCTLRLMLDGINELKVQPQQQRHERAATVVRALRERLQQAAGSAPLPMLLSIRQHHTDGLAGVDLLRVDVQDWTDQGVQAYLKLRFPAPPAPLGTPDKQAPWQAHWQALQKPVNAAALALCRVPLNLANQCDLWAGGYPHPVQHRAALYTAWLWLRLRRALGHGPGLAQEAVQAGQDRAKAWRAQGLLTEQDTARIASAQDWLQPAPAALPLAGLLLQHLLRQAEAQYWADAAAGRNAAQRCASVALPLAQVAPWITDADAHQAWRAAVAELGLADVDEAQATFGFAHQSWGEFLASVQLLAGDPPATVPRPPATGWRRVLPRWPSWPGRARAVLPPRLQQLHAACQAAHWPPPLVRAAMLKNWPT